METDAPIEKSMNKPVIVSPSASSNHPESMTVGSHVPQDATSDNFDEPENLKIYIPVEDSIRGEEKINPGVKYTSEITSKDSEYEDTRCFMSFIKSVYSERYNVLLSLITASLLSVSIYIWTEHPEESWLNIAAWRWMIYLTLLFPSWWLAYGILKLLTWLTRKIGSIFFSNDSESKRKTQDLLIFWHRYNLQSIFFLWALLLTLTFALWFAPAYGTEEELSQGSLEQWRSIYKSILDLHFVLVVFAAGSLLVDIIEFKYLTSFSARNLTPKIDDNIFQELVLMALAGYNSDAFNLLPTNMANDCIQLGHSQDRRAHVVANYVRANDLVHSLGVKLRVMSDKEGEVIKALVRKIRNNLKLYKERKRGAQNSQHTQMSSSNDVADTNLSEKDESQKKKKNPLNPIMRKDFMKKDLKCSGKEDKWENGENEVIESISKSLNSSRGTAARISKRSIENLLRKSFLKFDVEKAMEFVDPLKDDHNEFISVFLLEKTISEVCKDRRNLTTSLKDAARVTGQIKSWIWAGMFLIAIIVSMLIMGVRGVDAWAGFGSSILAFSFAFGGAMKDAFENFIFLLGGHPFDVGDKIFLGGTKMYEVKRVSLQTTELDHFGEIRVVQNKIVRCTEPLVNLSRSKRHWVSCEYLVDSYLLSPEFLENVKSDMKLFIQKDPETYQDDFRIDSYEFVPPEKIKLTLMLTMRFPLEQLGRSRIAQSKAAVAFSQSLHRHGAKYSTVLEWSERVGALSVK